jgi:hypothetical protein
MVVKISHQPIPWTASMSCFDETPQSQVDSLTFGVQVVPAHNLSNELIIQFDGGPGHAPIVHDCRCR